MRDDGTAAVILKGQQRCHDGASPSRALILPSIDAT
jgi:hypothetical protein